MSMLASQTNQYRANSRILQLSWRSLSMLQGISNLNDLHLTYVFIKNIERIKNLYIAHNFRTDVSHISSILFMT